MDANDNLDETFRCQGEQDQTILSHAPVMAGHDSFVDSWFLGVHFHPSLESACFTCAVCLSFVVCIAFALIFDEFECVFAWLR